MTFSFEVKADQNGMVNMNGTQLTQADALILVEDTLNSIGIKRIDIHGTLEVFSEVERKRRFQQLAQVGQLGDFQKSRSPLSV